MRRKGATFWLLNGQAGWRTAHTDGVSVGDVSGIRLAGNPDGPLALTSPDGSLGGLTLPRGMALDGEGTLYLLGLDEPWIKRFDPSTQRFVRLPAVGGRGEEARQFREPANIAIAGHNLYVADVGNHRIQVFDLRTLALRHVWGPWGADGRRVAAGAPEAWEPADVAAQAGVAYLLDRRYGRVYRHQPGTDALHLVVDEPAAANRWTRVAVDRDAHVYLLDAEASRLEIYDSLGQRAGDASDAGDVRDRFDVPAIRLDHKGRFCLPESLTRACDRRAPAPGPSPEAPLGLCPPWSDGGLIFDRQGQPAQVDPADPLGPKLYTTAGTWISAALDSQIYRCQWHRVELDLANLPAGTRVVVSTYTDGEFRPDEEIQALPDHLWDTHYTTAGQMQPPPNSTKKSVVTTSVVSKAAEAATTNEGQPVVTTSVVSKATKVATTNAGREFLIQSHEGQYLWLRLQLTGDGYATPAVESLRVHYPRESYFSYLPAVYAADDESRWFLERFLSIFQTEWDDLERQIDEIARYFDPEAVPAGAFLAYLARWLALPLEGAWDWEQKRHLLSAAPDLYPRRGTEDGLRDYLRIYLQNITGLAPAEQGAYPQIVEGFRERQHLMLSVENLADLGHGAPLWSPSVVGRLQLDVFSRESEVRLVSTGDPERDLFHEYAHRFRVFVPAAWIRTADDERMLRRALDAEKPAHTRYDLCLVEPRFRVGLQSTVGLDSVIGAYPVAQLACRHETDAPPSQVPRHRLGYDTILAGDPRRSPGLQVAPGTRVGIDTTLT